MIRITFEAPDRESLIHLVAQFLTDENYVRPALFPVVAPTDDPADEPAPEAPKADEQPEPSMEEPEPMPPTSRECKDLLIKLRSHPALGPKTLRALMAGYGASTFDELNPKDYQAIMTAATEMMKEAANNG